ncbi:hypothetical protein [Nonomuraea sp. NPDC001831]|uniref:VMAP-C domain-containing protein n=1 Tax=Nonomuraea sp. NPDC001831 TaxID=3364340 RepID=UPI0036B53C57
MRVATRVLPRYLVDAVADVSCLRDAETLRHIVESLGADRTRASFDVAGGVSLRGVIIKLMNELSEQPTGLAVLVEALERWEGGSAAIRRLRVATAAWEVELLENEEWDQLFTLLDRVRIPDLHRQYCLFLQRCGLPLPPVRCTEPWTVFLHAATLNARPGSALPCFDVLRDLLAMGAEADSQLEILDWAAEHDPHAPLGDEPVAGDEPVVKGSVWSPSDYLIIRVRPLLERGEGSDAILSHWQRTHPGGQIRGADRRVSLRHAEKEVRTLIRQIESDLAHRSTSDLALEFVLPRDLLHLRVEQWRKESFQGAVGVLGEDHEVVVRSMERLERLDLHGRWMRRWKAFSEERAGRVHWFPEDGRPHLLSDPPPAVVVLSVAPGEVTGRPAAEGPALDELGEALRVGVPVIVWARTGADSATFRAALRSLLEHREGTRDLPSLVKALRIASNGPQTHDDALIGRHVALLWDDPTRMPVASGAGGPSDSSEVEGA